MFTHVSMLHGLVDTDHDVLVFLLERNDLDRHMLINKTITIGMIRMIWLVS